MGWTAPAGRGRTPEPAQARPACHISQHICQQMLNDSMVVGADTHNLTLRADRFDDGEAGLCSFRLQCDFLVC